MARLPCDKSEDARTGESMKLLGANQSTTYLFRSLMERLALAFPGASVTLLAGSVETDGAKALPFAVIASTPLVRSPGWKRILSWAAFTLRFVWQLVRHPPDLALVASNPPLVPWAAGVLNLVMRRPYVVVVYDIYPDLLDRMGWLRRKALGHRFLLKLSSISLKRAVAVVTLGDDMARHLAAHCKCTPPRIEVIPNWADAKTYRPMAKSENPFAREHGLVGKFVVMYSGSFGATHDIESVLGAAGQLIDTPELAFVLIGKGTRLGDAEQRIRSLQLPNVMLLPWQPIAMAPLSLASADCHIVSLDAPYAGISFPSKFYTSLAVGAAIIALAPDGTDLWEAVHRHRVGITVRPGCPCELAVAVRRLMADEHETVAMRLRSRQTALSHYDEGASTARYAALVESVLQPHFDRPPGRSSTLDERIGSSADVQR